MRITVYMKPTCSYSVRALKLLEERELAFDTIDVSKDSMLKQEMIDKSGRTTTPQIFVGEYHVGGYDDLVGLDSTGKLDQVLAGDGELSAMHP